MLNQHNKAGYTWKPVNIKYSPGLKIETFALHLCLYSYHLSIFVARSFFVSSFYCAYTKSNLFSFLSAAVLVQTQLRIDSFFRMAQQEKQAIRSQRLRRAVICMKRKEREGGEEEDVNGKDEEDEIISPIKSKRGKATSQTQKSGGEGEGDRAAGGFLGSQFNVESPVTSLKDVSSASQRSDSPTACRQVTPRPKPAPQRRSSSSNSSDGDSDTAGDVAMVTARSVFEGNRRGRGTKHTRGRGRGKGKKAQGKNPGLKL